MGMIRRQAGASQWHAREAPFPLNRTAVRACVYENLNVVLNPFSSARVAK